MLDQQLKTYQELNFKHESTHRADQYQLIEPIEHLQKELCSAIKADKQAYQKARKEFKQRYNRLQRVFAPSALKEKASILRPLRDAYDRRKILANQVTNLLLETLHETEPREIRTCWNGSIAVVYNPHTGRAEWREYRHGGIHGAYNPHTRTIEWETAPHTGIYGVFNPQLNIVEWKRSFKGGVHGVYNPTTKMVEWYISFHSGVGGVYNPLTGEVEWKTSVRGGVVGYFDHNSQTVKWFEKWHHGLALISWDPVAKTYLTSSSSGWYGA